MRAVVDQGGCIGCGVCAAIAPDVFVMNDDGLAEAVADTTDDNADAVQEAMDECPVAAITQED